MYNHFRSGKAQWKKLPKSDTSSAQADSPQEEQKPFVAHFREMQHTAGMSNRQLAQAAQIGVATIARWRSGQNQPRSAELSSALKALGVDMATREQAMFLAQQSVGDATKNVSVFPLAQIGDLLRSLRARTRLTRIGLASALGVAPSQVTRWEREERTISPCMLERLLDLAGASEEERRAFANADATDIVPFPHDANHEEWAEEINRLRDAVGQQSHLMPGDLLYYAVSSHLQRSSLTSLPNREELLFALDGVYAEWLCHRGRWGEAVEVGQQMRKWVDTPSSKPGQWMEAGMFLWGHEVKRTKPRMAFAYWEKVLPEATDFLPGTFSSQVHREAADAARRAGWLRIADYYAQKAVEIADQWQDADYCVGARLILSRVRLGQKRPEEALALLPPRPLSQEIQGQGRWLLDHAAILLAMGETALAGANLHEVNALAVQFGMPYLAEEAEQIFVKRRL